MTNYPEYKRAKKLSSSAINAERYKKMYADYALNYPDEMEYVNMMLDSMFTINAKIYYLTYNKLYFCIDKEIEVISILNIGKSNMFKIQSYSLAQPEFDRKCILYTDKEAQLLKKLFPQFKLIKYYDIKKYIQSVYQSERFQDDKAKFRLKTYLNAQKPILDKRRSMLIQSQDDICI